MVLVQRKSVICCFLHSLKLLSLESIASSASQAPKTSTSTHMALWNFLAVTVILGKSINAAPTVAFPFNSQVPPVARIGEPFSYSFSSSTFHSGFPLSYTLSTAPKWLSLDSDTRTLSGTPSVTDAGKDTVAGVDIEITASDQSGSVTLNATLVISKNPAPDVHIPLISQLSSFGAFSSAPSTLLVHPSTEFKFNFHPGTFSTGDGKPNLLYYAITTDNTPLPAWISFDNTTLSFSGRTPDYSSLIEPHRLLEYNWLRPTLKGSAVHPCPSRWKSAFTYSPSQMNIWR